MEVQELLMTLGLLIMIPLGAWLVLSLQRSELADRPPRSRKPTQRNAHDIINLL
ncbi:MAG: hypothetical protein CEO22_223 [Candidatus Berkelbacteria bacterium Gr01-1014_85]|uniref:Uncharacterized protein n=1 Tax=Candidatus Berkelbacteria bacterium Gr01-1014_85 TaxID=2017150 RepID=A0A554JCV3_9BACT|nr:MAG: hypothetical protein CEO22_223 [Candidatus Berkelbacteria bacterium Gr01-1014_85]